jgi:hypothetical protein
MTAPATGLPISAARPFAATRMTADRAALILAAFAPAEMCAASLLRNTNQDCGTSPRGKDARRPCDAAGVRAHRRKVAAAVAREIAELLRRAGLLSDWLERNRKDQT